MKIRKVYGYECDVEVENGVEWVKVVHYRQKNDFGEVERRAGRIWERCSGGGWDRRDYVKLSSLRRGLKSGRFMIQ